MQYVLLHTVCDLVNVQLRFNFSDERILILNLE